MPPGRPTSSTASYSRNRLNVAVTRARVKSIIFFAQPLLNASPEVLDSPTVAVGLAYMRQLVQMARGRGSSRRFDLGEGAVADVVAMDKVVAS